ncbi:MAG TPA: hypothetical protein H9873_09700 [Candidatus Dorea gallistercoris]|uniref:Uncharacterized protein n=1 Tax=Candidatus Dorea gallistercoris TaxID=2838542 RepID=A0A9D1UEQ6_9FIRM|nr:hypothetical protein [Candidatus Dorea gallistercoris]
MERLKNINFIQWFICLVKQDMEGYVENKEEKRKMYRSLKRRWKVLRKRKEH